MDLRHTPETAARPVLRDDRTPRYRHGEDVGQAGRVLPRNAPLRRVATTGPAAARHPDRLADRAA